MTKCSPMTVATAARLGQISRRAGETPLAKGAIAAEVLDRLQRPPEPVFAQASPECRGRGVLSPSELPAGGSRPRSRHLRHDRETRRLARAVAGAMIAALAALIVALYQFAAVALGPGLLVMHG